MNAYPGLQEIRRPAASGEYGVAPATCVLLSDVRAPIRAVRIPKNVSSHCFLPESAEDGEKWGRYPFPGFDPTPSRTG